MKVITVLGTRPEIIRLSGIIPLLDKLCEHILVHTGQNFDHTLNEIFFKELSIRQPDYLFECKSATAAQEIGRILSDCENVFAKEKPDRLLVLGDTNSGLSAFVAKRMGIPVFHMEAGNRCYDDRVPEEVNRRVIDHSSDILMPYTERSRSNLLREGIDSQRIYVTGNPIKEILDHYLPQIDNSQIMNKLGLEPFKFFLITLHRAENVDNPERLKKLITSLHLLYKNYNVPVVCSLHPRTRSQLSNHGLVLDGDGVMTMQPLGLFDFIFLEKKAMCVLTDSGTVQEECCIFNIPNVTIRDVTERPETLEVGSNMLSGSDPDLILDCVRTVLTKKQLWPAPPEYNRDNVSITAVKILLGYQFGKQ